MFTRTFLYAAFERAAKTAGQAALLFIGADQFNVLAFDWPGLFGFAAGGAVLSLLTSLASAPVGAESSPSLVAGEDVR